MIQSGSVLTAVNLLSPNFDSWKVEAKLAKQQENVEIWGSTLQGSLVRTPILKPACCADAEFILLADTTKFYSTG